MPSVEINGVSQGGNEDSSSGDYKIKLLLPSSTTNGSGGAVQLGSDDFDPAIVDGLGKLTQKLEQAQKLQDTIGDGWDDVPNPPPKAIKRSPMLPVGAQAELKAEANTATNSEAEDSVEEVVPSAMPIAALVGALL